MRRILLVEDDRDLNRGLTFQLESAGYLVSGSACIGEGMLALEEQEVHLVLLDGNLPDGDGFAFCREIKKERDIPVILLTARDLEQDEIRGFDCGADDYITKPFRLPILLKRIEACLRSKNTGRETCIYQDDCIKIDFEGMTARLAGKPLILTPTEYKLLKILIANAERVMTKQLLLEKIWDCDGNFADEHVVAVNINRLRKKIECGGREYIRTMYGMGYQWKGGSVTWSGLY